MSAQFSRPRDLCLPVAKFLHEHSNFNDESFGVTRAQIETAVTAAKYVKDYYFRSIVEASAHILYSISISDAPSVERVGYSFTEATFHGSTITHLPYALY